MIKKRVLLNLSLIFIGLLLAVVFLSAHAAQGRTITVDDSGGADYTTIQAAVDVSSDGDTVLVDSGRYNEHVTICKSINLTGENRSTTIIDGCGGSGYVVTISTNNVNISMFTIRNSSEGSPNGGIKVTSSNNTISENNITKCDRGIIFFPGASNNTATQNIITKGSYGIDLSSSSNNTIVQNTVTDCEQIGVTIYASSNNITRNNVTNCGWVGIYFTTNSNNNTITLNNIYGNKQYGACLCSGASCVGNTLANNWWGNTSGPHNLVSNPTGTGDNITDGMPFSPWSIAPINTSTSSLDSPSNNGTEIYAPNSTTFGMNVTVVYAPNSTTQGICGWFGLEVVPANLTFQVNQNISFSIKAVSRIDTIVTIHSIDLFFIDAYRTILSQEATSFDNATHNWTIVHTIAETDTGFVVSINASSQESYPNIYYIFNSTLYRVNISQNNQTSATNQTDNNTTNTASGTGTVSDLLGGIVAGAAAPSVATLATLSLFGAAFYVYEPFKFSAYKLSLVLIPFYSRIDGGAYNTQREKLLKFIEENPGENFYTVRKELAMANGSVAYHLGRLETGGAIIKRKDGRYIRFYPMNRTIPSVDHTIIDGGQQVTTRKTMLSKKQQNIIDAIEKSPGITPQEIASKLGLSKQLVSYHIEILQENGLIKAQKKGKYLNCFVENSTQRVKS